MLQSYTRLLNAHTKIVGIQHILLDVPYRPSLNSIHTHYSIVQTGIHGTVNVSKLLIHNSFIYHK